MEMFFHCIPVGYSHARRQLRKTRSFLAPLFALAVIIHFYGDGYFGARHVPLYIDGKEVGKMHGARVVDVEVEPGKHQIYSGDKKSGIVVELKDGGEAYVKVTLGTNSFSGILHGQVTLVDPAQGSYEVEARRKAGK